MPSSSTTPPPATAADSPPVPSPAAPAKPMFRLSSHYLSESVAFVLLFFLTFSFTIYISQTGWFNRHEFYQKPEEVVVTVFAKGIPKQNVNVEFGDQIVSILQSNECALLAL